MKIAQKHCRRFWLAIVVLSFIIPAFSEDGGHFSYQAAQEKPKPAQEKPKAAQVSLSPATSKIKIDGALDEDAWQSAAVLKLVYEWLPGDNVPPPVDTDCLLTYDKDYFYIAFRAFDPKPKEIRAHLMDRDATDTLIQDDHISMIIDPFNDERRGFQFRANPLGVQADANFSESEGYEDFSWDAIWASAGKITDWGYAIEIAIPFNQLRFPKTQAAQTWGFSAERSYPRNVRHRITSHRRDRDVACLLCQFNKINGIKGITPGRNLEFDPTVTANRTDERKNFPTGPMERGKIKADPGLTARWGITPNLILNATINPDFSQVEADIAQLDVNTRYALYYPEKRPFFLEGADFFLTPIQAVFTRTVADPSGGLKLTGKSGKNALGVFGAYDRINNLVFPSDQESFPISLDMDVMSGVFRYRRDVGKSSMLGVLYTGRVGENYHNHLAGFDGFFRLSQTSQVGFQYLHSDTEYPGDVSLNYGQKKGSFGGDAVLADFLHLSRHWVVNANYMDYSNGFRADYGYLPQVNIRQLGAVVQRIVWGKPKGWFTRLQFGFGGQRQVNHQGDLVLQALACMFNYTGPLQSTARLQPMFMKEAYLGKIYDINRVNLGFEMKPASGIVIGLTGRAGDQIDYSNARKSSAVNLMPSLEYNFGRHINFIISQAFERLRWQGKRVYTANLIQPMLVYNLNVRTFIRAILQYRYVSRDPSLYVFPVDPKSSTFFTQFLFSYKINPQTVLFLGYSDNYFGMQGLDLTRTDRTFFIKIGYAWTK